MSSGSSRTGGQAESRIFSGSAGRMVANVVPDLLDGSKYRPGAGWVEMSSRSSRISRNVVQEQQTTSKCVLEQQDRSKCRPGAAGQVEMSSRGSWIEAKRLPDEVPDVPKPQTEVYMYSRYM